MSLLARMQTLSWMVKSARIRATWPIRSVLMYSFCSMKQLGVFLLPPGWDTSPSQGYPPPPALTSCTHLYTWVERCTVRVKCLAHEHKAMSSASARTLDRSLRLHLYHQSTMEPSKNLSIEDFIIYLRERKGKISSPLGHIEMFYAAKTYHGSHLDSTAVVNTIFLLTASVDFQAERWWEYRKLKDTGGTVGKWFVHTVLFLGKTLFFDTQVYKWVCKPKYKLTMDLISFTGYVRAAWGIYIWLNWRDILPFLSRSCTQFLLGSFTIVEYCALMAKLEAQCSRPRHITPSPSLHPGI